MFGWIEDNVLENRWVRLPLGLIAFAGALAIANASGLELQAAGFALLAGLAIPAGLLWAGRIAGDSGGDSAWGAIIAGGAAAAFIIWAWDKLPRLDGWGPWAAPALAVCVAINAVCLFFPRD
jgi:hypothetical protein